VHKVMNEGSVTCMCCDHLKVGKEAVYLVSILAFSGSSAVSTVELRTELRSCNSGIYHSSLQACINMSSF
jgi:hypothetical protein